MGISFSGLSTGLDTANIVRALTDAARIPVNRLEVKKSNYTAQKAVFNEIKSLMDSFEDAARNLETATKVLSFSATSSDEGVLSVAAGGDASAGSFSVNVTQLAAAQRTYSDAFSSRDTPGLFGTGTLTLTVGSEDPVDIAVDGSTTLESLASSINSSGAEATASVFYDGTDYRLQVAAKDTGTANAITFGEAGVTLGLSTPANTAQVAQDAVVEVDGFTATRSSNVVDDLFAGITLSLGSTGTSTVTVDADADAVRTKVQEFVDAHNAVQSKLAEQFRFDGTPDPRRPFADSTLRSMQRDISSAVTSAVSGLSGNVVALSQIGITSESDGSLKIDSTEFDEAFSRDPGAVGALFGGDSNIGVDGIADLLKEVGDRYTDFADGRLSTRIKGYDTRISDIDDQVARLEDQIGRYEQQLNAEFNALETLMSELQSQNQAMLAQLGAL